MAKNILSAPLSTGAHIELKLRQQNICIDQDPGARDATEKNAIVYKGANTFTQEGDNFSLPLICSGRKKTFINAPLIRHLQSKAKEGLDETKETAKRDFGKKNHAEHDLDQDFGALLKAGLEEGCETNIEGSADSNDSTNGPFSAAIHDCQNDLNEDVDGSCNLESSAWGIYFNGGNNDDRGIESINNAVLGLVRIAGGASEAGRANADFGVDIDKNVNEILATVALR